MLSGCFLIIDTKVIKFGYHHFLLLEQGRHESHNDNFYFFDNN